jgi:hypothetical protein
MRAGIRVAAAPGWVVHSTRRKALRPAFVRLAVVEWAPLARWGKQPYVPGPPSIEAARSKDIVPSGAAAATRR